MLAEIAISNLGVISHASAELSPGLTVLTGETGAGKTMVVTGLRLLTGGRADASRVRTGSGALTSAQRVEAERRVRDTHWRIDTVDVTIDEDGHHMDTTA